MAVKKKGTEKFSRKKIFRLKNTHFGKILTKPVLSFKLLIF
jgi:hypothetical protein